MMKIFWSYFNDPSTLMTMSPAVAKPPLAWCDKPELIRANKSCAIVFLFTRNPNVQQIQNTLSFGSGQKWSNLALGQSVPHKIISTKSKRKFAVLGKGVFSIVKDIICASLLTTFSCSLWTEIVWNFKY